MNKIAQSNNQGAMVLSFISGLAYVTAGFLQLLTSLGLFAYWAIPGDFIIGIILVILSAVFFTGVFHFRRDNKDAFAFLMVGMILAGVVFFLHLVTLTTNMLGWVLRLEDWLDWNIMNNLAPGLWLFPILAIFLGVLRFSNGEWNPVKPKR